MSKDKGDNEKKDANTKSVTVGGEDKLLLMDDDETKSEQDTMSETDLQEILSKLVAEALQELTKVSD